MMKRWESIKEWDKNCKTKIELFWVINLLNLKKIKSLYQIELTPFWFPLLSEPSRGPWVHVLSSRSFFTALVRVLLAFSSLSRTEGLSWGCRIYCPCSLLICVPESCYSLLSAPCRFILRHERSCSPSWKNWNSWCRTDSPRCPKVGHRLGFSCPWAVQKSSSFGNLESLKQVSNLTQEIPESRMKWKCLKIC